LDFGCAVPIALDAVLPAHTLEVAAGLRCWICENAKSTRAFLARVRQSRPLSVGLQDMDMRVLPRELQKKGDTLGPASIASLLQPALDGWDMGLTSEAGMPAVADPGASVVRAAHDLGIGVVPLVGPVSMLLALAGSGLNGQNYAFVGYLPIEETQRAHRIRELESLALKTGQTQQFIETPYRNSAMLSALLRVLQPATRLALACGLTLERQSIRSASVGDWKLQGLDRQSVEAIDQPAIFSIGR
jgi:16S rRNA (cytidine1402-2'-O)-methyltransferase